MRWFAFPIVLLAATSVLPAQHPDRRNQPVRQPIDLIGPLGNRLPPSYRRTYNRPTYLGGKIAYWIAPSSQEAMAWQAAYRAGAYRDHAPRLERHYFFPKPWEAIQIGARDGNQAQLENSEEVPTPAEELPGDNDPVSGGLPSSPVVVSQLERETIGEYDGFDREFGAILLADPTSFQADKASAVADPHAPGPQFHRPAEPRQTPVAAGVVETADRSQDRDPAPIGNTLQRLRAENEQLRRSLGSQTD